MSGDLYETGLCDAQAAGWFNSETGELAPGFPVGHGDLMLDLGLGDAAALRFAAHRGARLILADPDRARLTEAEAWVGPARLVEAHLTDGDPLPLAAASVHHILALNAIQNASTLDARLAELARVAAPGALLLIAAPDPTLDTLLRERGESPPAALARDAFAAQVAAAGFTVLAHLHDGFFWAMLRLLGQDHAAAPAWAQFWRTLLDTDAEGRLIELLDRLLPARQVIVAERIEGEAV